MEIGLVLPDHARWEDVVELASGAERLGVGSLWVSDPSHGRGAVSGDGPMEPLDAIEPLMALAGLARVTAVARLGVLLQAATRPPAVAAKALSTIDVLSGGRVIVGLDERPGAGAAEADALGEALQVMRGAFGGGPFTFHGRYHRCVGLRSRPLPIQRPAPALWVSGSDGNFLSLAASHADGWGPSGSACSTGEYRSMAASLDEACEAAGRDPAAIHRFVRREVPAGGAGQLAEDVADWRDSGVATLMLDRRGVALRAASGAALEHELEIVASAVSSTT